MPRNHDASKYGAWFTAAFAVAGGLSSAFVFYLLVARFNGFEAPSVWENSAPLTLAYAAIIAFAVFAPVPARFETIPWLKRLIMVAVFSAACSTPTAIGPLVGVFLGITALGLSLFVRRLACKADPQGPYSTLSLTEALALAVLFSATVGSLWTLDTATAYADEFVVLAWVFLGLFHLFVLGGALLFLRVLGRSDHLGRLRPLLLVGIFVFGGLCFAASIFFRVWSAGDDSHALTGPATWSEAFRPLPATNRNDVSALQTQTFQKKDLIELLQKQPNPPLSHLATLYLLTRDVRWAEKFHDQILAEAASAKFTTSGGSIKYGQRHAMVSAIYFLEVNKALPTLFSSQEIAVLERWFSRITQGILTPGWVDWLYAIPMQVKPEGPYLNQEIGAGALAAMQQVLASAYPDLSNRASRYVARRGIGWRGNFRNPDDSLEYQDVWMGSAFAIARYADHMNPAKTAGMPHAIQWVKCQLPLSTIPLNYGTPHVVRPLDTLAIGAFVLKDGESRWLLEQELTNLIKAGEPLPADTTALWLWDDNVKAIPYHPSSMSIMGPTGYAFRPGALEPDKIVLRASDTGIPNSEELYALANLRSAGWHRYPSTNTLIRLNLGDRPLVAEDIIKKRYHWMPAGRAVHRDGKIDRVRLNGLLVEATGLGALINGVTGIYSPWSQDVPPFARLGLWKKVGDLQVAKVLTNGWAGISQERFFIQEGSTRLTILDHVAGSKDRKMAVAWNLVGFNEATPTEYVNRAIGKRDVVLNLVPGSAADIEVRPIHNRFPAAYPDAAPNLRVITKSSAPHFVTAAVFSTGGHDEHALSGHVFPNTHGKLLTLRTLRNGVDNLLIVGNGGKWESEGISSDAQLIRVETFAKETIVTMVDGTFVHMRDLKKISRVAWDGSSLKLGDVSEPDGSIVFKQTIHSSGVLNITK